MGEHGLGPYLPFPGTYPGFQGSKNERSKSEAKAGQGILSSRCEVRLEKIRVPHVEGQRTECREKPLTKESCQGNTVQALVVKPKTIKQVLHNAAVHSKFNEGHEDDLFGQSKGEAGYGPLKKQYSNWEGKLISKEESSGDESSIGSKSDLVPRGFTRLRLSEFVQISEFFQFYITDIVRHLSHFPKVSI